MLNGISSLLSPYLVKILMEMGHGDEIVFADAHFPVESNGIRVVRSDGVLIPDLLEAVLPLFPLDDYTTTPLTLMNIVTGDSADVSIWDTYYNITKPYKNDKQHFEYLNRKDFYNQSKKAYAIVATSETSQYANLILKKGIVKV